jgi:hypothetical protein
MSSSKPVIVLVPGAFHRPSVWNKVADGLRKHGYQVLTPPLAVTNDLSNDADLASKTPQDDAAIITAELLPLLDQDNEAIIVTHSYGIFCATLVVEGNTAEERAAKGLKGGIVSFMSISGIVKPARGVNIMNETDVDPPVMPYHILKVSV